MLDGKKKEKSETAQGLLFERHLPSVPLTLYLFSPTVGTDRGTRFAFMASRGAESLAGVARKAGVDRGNVE